MRAIEAGRRSRRRGERTRRSRGERGAAAVEFALVLPLLMMLIFGLVSMGLAYSDHLSATNAVREAARYGAAADISDATPGAWASSVRTRLKDTYFNGAGATVTDTQICVRLVQKTATSSTTIRESLGSQCGAAPSPPSNMTVNSCAVMVWMRRPAELELLIFPSIQFHLAAASTAYYGREVTPCTAP